MLAVLFTSLMVAAKPARTVASKNDLGMKIRIDDAQAKELYFKIEKN